MRILIEERIDNTKDKQWITKYYTTQWTNKKKDKQWITKYYT